MNAIKLYISAARLILENDHIDQSMCKEIINTFPHLEQSLTCTVCKNILSEPYSPMETICQHHVCKSCIGGRKRLKPSCSWCKDYKTYGKNTQLQCLLACYKGLCDYIKYSNLLNQLSATCPSTRVDREISSIVQKGTELSFDRIKKVKTESYDGSNSKNEDLSKDLRYRLHLRRDPSNSQINYTYNNSSMNETDSYQIPRIRIKHEQRTSSPVSADRSLVDSKADFHHTSRLRSASDHSNNYTNLDKMSDSTSDELNSKMVYSVSFTGTRSKIILKRKHVNSKRDQSYSDNFDALNHCNSSQEDAEQSQRDSVSTENSRFRKIKIKPVTGSSRPNCRCGNATPKPGKLTCCGQRCACYMQSKACSGCRCRGCRNPHMIDGVKVLGRFTDDNFSELPIFQNSDDNFHNQQMNQIFSSNNTNGEVNVS